MIGPRGRAGIVLLTVFAAGLFTGAAFERHHPSRVPAVLSLDDEHAAAIGELRDVLDLDEAQVQRLHEILSERQEVVQLMWEQLRPEVQEAMTSVHEEFAAILRPDQRQRFHDWLNQQRARHQPLPRHR